MSPQSALLSAPFLTVLIIIVGFIFLSIVYIPLLDLLSLELQITVGHRTNGGFYENFTTSFGRLPQ